MMHSLTIVSWNARSLVPKIDEVRDFVYRNSVDILCLQETWLNRLVSDSVASIPNYDLIRVDRPNQSGYGGVAMYIRNELQYARLLLGGPSDCESLWVRLNLSYGYVTVGNIYRPLKSNCTTFLASLEDTVAPMCNCILIGDFNMQNRQVNSLTGFLSRSNLRQLVSVPTFAKRNYVSMLDLLITNLPDELIGSVVIGQDLGSDHLPVVAKLKVRPIAGKVKEKETVCCRRKYAKTSSYVGDIGGLCTNYSGDLGLSVDEIWSRFVDDFSKIYDFHFPLRKIQLTHKCKIPLTPSLIQSINSRRRLYRQAFITRSDIMWDRYYSYKKVLDRILKSHRSTNLKQRIGDAPTTAAKWAVLRTVVLTG
jgi:hypothetical protein